MTTTTADGTEPITIEVRDLIRVHLNPGDVLAVRVVRSVSHDQIVQIKAHFEDVFPNNRIIVYDGLELAVVTTETVA
jgi:hypothetical protein